MEKLLYIAVLLFTISAIGQTPAAFPEALGFGAVATGGRGGTVYVVTNTNDSGTGSFREAITSVGARIIVFDIGGRINLSSNITVSNDNFTILGNSAPSDSGGITISGASVIFSADNFIVRYIRFRLGDNGYKDADGNVVGSNSTDEDTIRVGAANNFIFDHCEFMWSIDENFSINSGGVGTSDGTLQNSIVAEGLAASHHQEGSHSMATLAMINTERFTYARNYFLHHSERHPRIRENNSFEFINNVTLGFRYGSIITGGCQFQIVNNHYKESSFYSIVQANLVNRTGSGVETEQAYISGNTWDTTTSVSEHGSFTEVGSPTVDSGITPLTAAQAIDTVLAHAGSRYPLYDSHSSRVIGEFTTETRGTVDTQEQVGGFNTPATGTSWTDTDSDGMDDTLENSKFGDLTQTATGDFDSDGYNNIEDMYNDLVSETPTTVNVTSVSVAPASATISEGETTQLIATVLPTDATDKSGVWSSATPADATVSASGLVSWVSDGSSIITFTTNDGSFTDTSTITTSATPAGSDANILRVGKIRFGSGKGGAYLGTTKIN